MIDTREKYEMEEAYKKDLNAIFELLNEFTNVGLVEFELKYKLWRINRKDENLGKKRRRNGKTDR